MYNPIFISGYHIYLWGNVLRKSYWVQKPIEQSKSLFTEPPEGVLYCYGIYQPNFELLAASPFNVELYAGVPNGETITNFTSNKKHSLIVFDDLQHKICSDSLIGELFTQLAHHLNVRVVLLSNNIFFKNFSRTITVNVHAFVLLRNSRNMDQISRFSHQVFPRKSVEFLNAFVDCTNRAFGYLVIDLSPHRCDQLSLRTNIFEGEDPIVCIL